jgi:hypothetical protein
MHKIKTFEEILKESFYNPFDDNDENAVSTKPGILHDESDVLKLRREVFNINRVVYSKKDNGSYMVTSKTNFAKGEIVEICPAIFVGAEAKSIPNLKNYIFEVDKERNIFAVVLGLGSIYSHSEKNNLDYAYHRGNKQFYFLTNRTINIGEELTINYGRDYWSERNNLGLISKPDASTSTIQPINLQKVENESMVQPIENELGGQTTTKNNGSPISSANPAVSGVPILSSGQS